MALGVGKSCEIGAKSRLSKLSASVGGLPVAATRRRRIVQFLFRDRNLVVAIDFGGKGGVEMLHVGAR